MISAQVDAQLAVERVVAGDLPPVASLGRSMCFSSIPHSSSASSSSVEAGAAAAAEQPAQLHERNPIRTACRSDERHSPSRQHAADRNCTSGNTRNWRTALSRALCWRSRSSAPSDSDTPAEVSERRRCAVCAAALPLTVDERRDSKRLACGHCVCENCEEMVPLWPEPHSLSDRQSPVRRCAHCAAAHVDAVCARLL